MKIRCFEWIDWHSDSYDQYVFVKKRSFFCVSFGGEVRTRESYKLSRILDDLNIPGIWRELGPEETEMIKGLWL
jgi:hypothetical protein